jgi:hypothetical protein
MLWPFDAAESWATTMSLRIHEQDQMDGLLFTGRKNFLRCETSQMSPQEMKPK